MMIRCGSLQVVSADGEPSSEADKAGFLLVQLVQLGRGGSACRRSIVWWFGAQG